MLTKKSPKMNKLKTIILSGGFGTRISEETNLKPKPMIEVGGKPILWHIMKIYSFYGFNSFLVALGYKGDLIKKFFLEYIDYSGDISILVKNKKKIITRKDFENWEIGLVDTGVNSNTGGRVKALKDYIGSNRFLCTYGDGVSNVNLKDLLKFHVEHRKLATVTAVRPPARFGELLVDEKKKIVKFKEKPLKGDGWINGGFMVFEPEVLNMIQDSSSSLESELLENLSKENQLSAYLHSDFWQCMDTKRDLNYLENLWSSGQAPWKLW